MGGGDPPKDGDEFFLCKAPEACLGAENPSLTTLMPCFIMNTMKAAEKDVSWRALYLMNFSCDVLILIFVLNPTRSFPSIIKLPHIHQTKGDCATAAALVSLEMASNYCRPCLYLGVGATVIASLGFIFVIMVFAGFIWQAMHMSSDDNTNAGLTLKIAMAHMQVMAIASNLPFKWTAATESMFQCLMQRLRVRGRYFSNACSRTNA